MEVRSLFRSDQDGYILAIQTLVPQIEGIVRLHYFGTTGEAEPKTRQLLAHVLDQGVSKTASDQSLFFEKAFLTYLRDVFFAKFDLTADHTPLSRHAVAHGVARPEDYTESRALQAILVLDQVFFFL